ncbi:hypothetical protein NPS01_41370 [Nocardioides psychrotolerans]|nr:hypothetical protein NPS01_41370 [Nocardioides psychrotolerans]
MLVDYQVPVEHPQHAQRAVHGGRSVVPDLFEVAGVELEVRPGDVPERVEALVLAPLEVEPETEAVDLAGVAGVASEEGRRVEQRVGGDDSEDFEDRHLPY